MFFKPTFWSFFSTLKFCDGLSEWKYVLDSKRLLLHLKFVMILGLVCFDWLIDEIFF